ncbi:hypothetical protein [Mesorhizobium sp. BE184]|uniref:hypothetical protein n=1 Tax=Mesorhizobium sp. BE184 TaxID=2817714 RepID=UPI0038620C3E
MNRTMERGQLTKRPWATWHNLGDNHDAFGFPLVPLTGSNARRIVRPRDICGLNTGESAGTARLVSCGASIPAVDPTDNGRCPVPCDGERPVPHLPARLARIRQSFRFAAGLAALTAGLWFSPAQAQDAQTQIIYPGSMAVTGFAGTTIPGIENGLPPGVDPVDETFIDTGLATLRVFDPSSLGGPASGQLVSTPPPFEVTAGQIGQVFGLTYDDGMRDGLPSDVPNLYAGATSLHGLRIVTPDADGDGRPERQRRGAADAVFMDGQFGEENGGGPGTIWKIDGISGTVSKLADIDGNSGPGIGDVTFDGKHRQFFASDLDNGLIHRIGADGNLLDTFDHGVAGRQGEDLEAVADDGAVMDIRNPVFDSEDPESWGYTQDQRRVWAVAYRSGRLYYSVGEEAEIWSVSITENGGFGTDPRRELTVKAERDQAVTDIAFGSDGALYLAQRGPLENRYDYSQFADSGKGEVLRYVRETPDDPATESAWVESPQSYAVGFPEGHRQAAGGLDLQYGYDRDGNLDTNACAATLLATGDKLRDNPAYAERLAAGGPLAVHGVQITGTENIRPANEPPFASWFVDFDGYFEDPQMEGQVGDVEVWRPCQGSGDVYDETLEGFLPFYPPYIPPGIDLPFCEPGHKRPDPQRPDPRRPQTHAVPTQGEPGRDRQVDCRQREPDLKIEKRADVKRCTIAGGCAFTITVTNVGEAPYHGAIVLDEVTMPAGSTLDAGPNPPWTCAPATSPMSCTHPETTLNPGQSVDLSLSFKPAAGWQGRTFANCARFDYRGSNKTYFGRTENDRACARIPLCQRGDRDKNCRPPPEKKADLILKKRARSPVCTAEGVCTFIIDVINNGSTTYSGPLTVADSYPTGAPSSSTFGPTPPWTCGPNGLSQFRCDHPGIVLPPGASTSIGVKAIMPAGYQRDIVQNCAEVKAIGGETDLTNNKACATARFRRPNGEKPALRITKQCNNAANGGATVSCRIAVVNAGTVTPAGSIRVDDAATLIGSGNPVQIQNVTPDGVEWSCGGVPSANLSCKIPGEVLTPGASRHFDVTVAGLAEFENCARATQGPAPGDDIVYPIGKACAKGGGVRQAPIRVEKTGDAECRVGQPCSFRITIANDGDSAFSAPMRVGDAIGINGADRLEGVTVKSISPPFGCDAEPTTLPLSCIANLSLDPGQSRSHSVTIVIPDAGPLTAMEGRIPAQNCVGVVSPETPVRGGVVLGRGADGSGKASACHDFTIVKDSKKPEPPRTPPGDDACPATFVMSPSGTCTCPTGATFRNGQCSGGPVDQPQPEQPRPERPKPIDPQPEQCVLLKGQIRTGAGECVCPRGTQLLNGACRTPEKKTPEKPPVRLCKLLPGQIRTQAGDCVCPRGSEFNGKRCVSAKKPVLECDIRGQIRTKRGSCVCPRGMEVVRGSCRPARQLECPEGTVARGGRCILLRQRDCPRGMIGEYPDCFEPRRPIFEFEPRMIEPFIPRGGDIRRRPGRSDNFQR